MIRPYEIKQDDNGVYALYDYQGNQVYEWSEDGYVWPDEDAAAAAVDSANVGDRQKAFFATMMLGPDTPTPNNSERE